MQTFLLTAGIMGFLMLAMAIGVILQRKELKGSCGGVGGVCACENAGKPQACLTTGDPATDVFRAPGEITGLRRS